ncbi:hypothetical protein BJ138DRAFT_1176159 [Hygrophoropsis aurantiaca]|uniref:Uncharacterized protein n=1 Tax=Hygrophoropsis aurantiaca TaxID=72124 RepID=A0ACB8ARE9_9AGAM|nr:hypothetical protein BJ138DRAFT_1176159 [Hygrophoropsis aurantiaca]
MNQANTVCLSVAPNFRCINLSQLQFEVLIIPPALELVFCISLIMMKWGSGRMHLLLAGEGIIYFILALTDMLSHVAPAARNSLSIFKAMDIFVGSVSFIPLLFYAVFLFWLSFREFIPNLPIRHQALPRYLLILFIPALVAINEVSSFVGITIRTLPLDMQDVLVIGFARTIWFSLSQFSLALYTANQLVYFLLCFYRLGKAFLDQRRIESTASDEYHFFNGIAWTTVGIKLGAIEAIVGFAEGGFAVPLSRRILRLLGRACLIIGCLKGLDACENFENLTNELRGPSRRSKHLSNLRDFVSNPRLSTFRRLSRLSISPAYGRNSPMELSPTDKENQRVTVHYAKGQAPFLQIRFSALDFPAPAILAEGTRRRSCSGILQTYNGLPSNSQFFQSPNGSKETLQGTSRGAPRAKSAMPAMQMGDMDLGDWDGRIFRGNTRPESGQTISDNLSVVRQLAMQFPSLPPRVTGRYRGSILGQGYEEDPYPVVGISRETSLKREAEDQSVEGATSLSTNGSIKRKPAPPLLPEAPFVNRREVRPVSTWGGITMRMAEDHGVPSPLTPTSPWTGTTAYSPRPGETPAPDETLSSPASRRFAPRNIINRASRALSDASVRSAEWFASSRSQLKSSTQLTPASIELYRSGGSTLGGGEGHLSVDPGDVPEDVRSDGTPASPSQDDWTYHAGNSGVQLEDSRSGRPRRPTIVTRVSVGRGPMRTTPTPTHVDFGRERERVLSSHGSVGYEEMDAPRIRPDRRSKLREEHIGPEESFFLAD